MKEYQVKVIRSGRRTLCLEVLPDCTVLVRAPYRMKEKEIECFLAEKKGWIDKHLTLAERTARSSPAPITPQQIAELRNEALRYIPERVRYYAALLGVSYGKITIRCQKTKWGSCSAKGNLNFNCLLMRLPAFVIDSVVVHELCHRLEMNHSAAFYREVRRVFPAYEEARKLLREEGAPLMHAAFAQSSAQK